MINKKNKSEITELLDTDESGWAGGKAIEMVIAHADSDVRSMLVRVGESIGHTIRGTCESVPQLVEACLPAPPDLIVCGVEIGGRDVIAKLVEISERQPTPAIIVTPKDGLANVEEALRDHVMAYLIEPIDEDQIKPTIYLVCERFKQFELLKAENDDLKQTLVDRKLIERAKGILMGQFDLTEEEAFRRLQKLAQSKRMKLAKVAAAVSDVTDQRAK